MTTPARSHDWVEQFDSSLTRWKDTPFAWGTHDCATAVCNHVQAMTGIDVGAEIRGKYTSAETAVTAIKDLTGKGGDLEDAVVYVTARHNFPEVGVKFAHRGDVVLFDTPWGQALGIVHLNGRDAVVTGPDGLKRLKTLNARRAWRIPFV